MLRECLEVIADGFDRKPGGRDRTGKFDSSFRGPASSMVGVYTITKPRSRYF